MSMATLLNARAWDLVETALSAPQDLKVNVHSLECGARVVDFGVQATGSLAAGMLLARACLANLATVSLHTGQIGSCPWPMVQVSTDSPLSACLLSQYAGWEIKASGYRAMGSGPMRALAGREELFHEFEYTEQFSRGVGVLESDSLPTTEIAQEIASRAHLEPQNLLLLVAPTSSLAGSLQINARSVETALHKLHELKFDVRRIVSALGSAPLSPVAPDTLTAIGRTNDAILFGGQVTLYVQGEDASIEELGPRVPALASGDYGKPFADLFKAVNYDFYQIDPLLFSPAQVIFQNIETGRVHCFGQLNQELLMTSFGLPQEQGERGTSVPCHYRH